MVFVLKLDVFVAWALLMSKLSSELSGAEPWSAVASSYMLALGMERLMIVKSWDKYLTIGIAEVLIEPGAIEVRLQRAPNGALNRGQSLSRCGR